MTKKSEMLIRRSAGGLYTIHGPDGLYWEDINAKKLRAIDAVNIASQTGLTHEQLGQVLAIMASRDPAERAARLNVPFEQK